MTEEPNSRHMKYIISFHLKRKKEKKKGHEVFESIVSWWPSRDIKMALN